MASVLVASGGGPGKRVGVMVKASSLPVSTADVAVRMPDGSAEIAGIVIVDAAVWDCAWPKEAAGGTMDPPCLACGRDGADPDFTPTGSLYALLGSLCVSGGCEVVVVVAR